MNPRHVRRSNARPSYSRRPAPARRSPRSSFQRPSLQLPAIKIVWIRLVGVALVILLVLLGLNRLTRLQHLRVQGNHSLTSAHITQLAEAGLHRQWFGHNIVLVNTGDLVSYLEAADPGIQQATASRSSLHTLTITIQERRPSLNWKTQGTVYLLDANATVIGPTKGVYASLPTVVDGSNLPVKVGDRVAPTQFVAFCITLAQLLPTTGYQVAQITVPTSTSEVYVTTTAGLVLKFDTTRAASDEIADLKQVQAELAAAKKAPTQYIDLRIEHKAYYK